MFSAVNGGGIVLLNVEDQASPVQLVTYLLTYLMLIGDINSRQYNASLPDKIHLARCLCELQWLYGVSLSLYRDSVYTSPTGDKRQFVDASWSPPVYLSQLSCPLSATVCEAFSSSVRHIHCKPKKTHQNVFAISSTKLTDCDKKSMYVCMCVFILKTHYQYQQLY